MYWLRIFSLTDILLGGLHLWIWLSGGYLLIRHVFRINSREVLLAGAGMGMVCYLFGLNVLAQIVSIDLAIWLSALLVLLGGLLAAWRSDLPVLGREDWNWTQLRLLVGTLAIIMVVTLIGRGVEIFDDRKNLSLISLMATGEIPPAFYMNPERPFSYHYGFQILGATLVRLGNFFPWSAFDFSKGIMAGLAVMLGYLWGWRASGRKSVGFWTGLFILFASGARWALNFLPQSLLIAAGENISFWGTSIETANTLIEALSSAWSVRSGPPVPIPFSFANGLFAPFFLGAQAGPRSLSLLILFLLLILVPNTKSKTAYGLLIIPLALMALAAEASFVLILFAIFLLMLLSFRKSISASMQARARRLFLIAAISALISIFQGGTLTGMARDLLQGWIHPAGSGALTGASTSFSLHWPPVITSSHLGELQLSDPYQGLVGILEMGAVLLVIPIVIAAGRKWFRAEKVGLVLFLFAAATGFVLPFFVGYGTERDITRLTTFGLMGFALLGLQALSNWEGKERFARFENGVRIWKIAMVFGGVVVAGSLITAMPTGSFGDQIMPVDAQMTQEIWNELEEDALIFDSHAWRIVAISGRYTRSSVKSFERLPAWEEYGAHPIILNMARDGYDYIYMDTYWRDTLSSADLQGFEQDCVVLHSFLKDDCANCERYLWDIRNCGDE